MDGFKIYEGKKVFIILKNKRQYTGKIVEVADNGGNVYFVTLLDKFGKYVSFFNQEIEVIQQEGKG